MGSGWLGLHCSESAACTCEVRTCAKWFSLVLRLLGCSTHKAEENDVGDRRLHDDLERLCLRWFLELLVWRYLDRRSRRLQDQLLSRVRSGATHTAVA